MPNPDDLSAWLDVLAGRKSAPPSDEAARLRDLIKAQDRWIEESIRAQHPSEELALEELRYRLQRARFARKSPWRWMVLPFALAATLLLAINLRYFLGWPGGGAPVPMSANAPGSGPAGQTSSAPSADAMQRGQKKNEIRQAQPSAVAGALRDQLSRAGIPSTLRISGEQYVIDFVVEENRTLRLGEGVTDAGMTLGPGHYLIHLSAP